MQLSLLSICIINYYFSKMITWNTQQHLKEDLLEILFILHRLFLSSFPFFISLQTLMHKETLPLGRKRERKRARESERERERARERERERESEKTNKLKHLSLKKQIESSFFYSLASLAILTSGIRKCNSASNYILIFTKLFHIHKLIHID